VTPRWRSTGSWPPATELNLSCKLYDWHSWCKSRHVDAVCVIVSNLGQVTNNSPAHPVAYSFQQPGCVPFVQPPPSSIVPLSSFCSNALNTSSVIPGVVAYPNQLMAPVNQVPTFTQVPPPTLQWVDTGRQALLPQNACVRILPGVSVPKVEYANSVVLPSAKLNWPATDKKMKVS